MSHDTNPVAFRILKHEGVEVGVEDAVSVYLDACARARVLVFYSVSIYEEFRGKGLGKLFHRQRLERAASAGYVLALCQVQEDNLPQMRILNGYGWTRVTYLDSKTLLMKRDLREPIIYDPSRSP